METYFVVWMIFNIVAGIWVTRNWSIKAYLAVKNTRCMQNGFGVFLEWLVIASIVSQVVIHFT
ncbi:hypothetical protein D3C85_681000 [compost metagenome]